MKRFTRPEKITLTLIFAFAVLAVIGCVRAFHSGGNPFTPPAVTYTDTLTPDERAFLEHYFTEHPVTADLTITAETLSARSDSNSDLIFDILVPVTDFYDPRSSITSAELIPNSESDSNANSDSNTNSELSPTSDASSIPHLISIRDLQPTQKLLALDGAYFFDDFNSGAQFRTFHLEGSDATTTATQLNNYLATSATDPTSNSTDPLAPLPTSANTLSFAQTGVTALTRAMTTRLQQTGDAAAFAANLAPFLSSKDLTHISNEVSFADDCQGGTGTTTLCADWRMLDVLTAIGTDIVELTGNHNNDYGASNNLATINKYHELGLQTYGGGLDETSAATPLRLDAKNAHLTLLAYNQSTSTKENGQGATGDHPGANIYDETRAATDIATAKQNGDFVIVDVQYFECYSYPEHGQEMPECDAPISGQETFFKHLIDLGADMVIGTQAHHPQTYELYNGKPIYYGLGNLFFDQTYWPGTTRSLILTHYFIADHHVQTRLTPTVYDTTYATRLMDESEAAAFLERLNAAR